MAVEDNVKETNFNRVIDVSLAKIINIDDLDEQNTDYSTNKSQNNEVKVHPDLVDINFKSRADQTSNALYAKQWLAINPVVECDNTIYENTGIMSKIEINDEPPVSPCVPQPENSDSDEQFLNTRNAVEVPVCNDLVDLSCEVNHETNPEPSVVILNSDLKGLSYPAPTTPMHSVNAITFVMTVHFCKVQ